MCLILCQYYYSYIMLVKGVFILLRCPSNIIKMFFRTKLNWGPWVERQIRISLLASKRYWFKDKSSQSWESKTRILYLYGHCFSRNGISWRCEWILSPFFYISFSYIYYSHCVPSPREGAMSPQSFVEKVCEEFRLLGIYDWGVWNVESYRLDIISEKAYSEGYPTMLR